MKIKHQQRDPRCGAVDSLGNYRIDSVGPGRRLLAVHCATIHDLASHQLAFERIVPGDTDLGVSPFEFRVDSVVTLQPAGPTDCR